MTSGKRSKQDSIASIDEAIRRIDREWQDEPTNTNLTHKTPSVSPGKRLLWGAIASIVLGILQRFDYECVKRWLDHLIFGDKK